MVTREELRNLLWPDHTFVDFEHGLNTSIKELRAALNDSVSEPRYIETLPKLGYRMLAPVTAADQTPGAPEVPLLPKNLPISSPAASPASIPRSAFLSRARLAVPAALVALIITALGAIYFLHRGRAAVLREKDTIVVADFQNATGEPIFDEALKQALTVALEQSPYFRVLPDRRSLLILKQMGHSPDQRVTGPVAAELCQRAGSKVLVQGSISSLGSNYLIGLNAIRCDNSDDIAREQAEASRKEDVIRLLGTAASQLRNRLGESVGSIQKHGAPLEQVTTSSLDALTAYGMAMATFTHESARQAIPFFQRAIQLDPSFSMAYGQLANVYRNLGETELSRENAAKAFDHRDRLTESERLVIEGWYESEVNGDLEKATQLYEMELRDYSPSAGVLNDLGAMYGELGRYEKAIELSREALRLEASSESYANLAIELLGVGDRDGARAMLDEAAAKNLPAEFLFQERYWAAFLNGNTQEMERVVAAAAKFPDAQALTLGDQARTEAYFGRMKKSRIFTESLVTLLESQRQREPAANCLADAALREAEFGENARMRQYASRALRLARSQAAVTLAALAFAEIGDARQSNTLAEELNAKHPSDTLLQKYWLPTIRGITLLHQRDWSKAVEALGVAIPFDSAAPNVVAISPFYPAYVRGQAYLAGENARQAAQEFHKIIDHPGMVINFPLGALAHLWLARAYASSGETTKARDSYRTLLQLWNQADPDLMLLVQAREESARLEQTALASTQ